MAATPVPSQSDDEARIAAWVVSAREGDQLAFTRLHERYCRVVHALAAARERDTLSLFSLLPRVAKEACARIFDRMASLSEIPEGVTREAVLALDDAVLETWWDELEGGVWY